MNVVLYKGETWSQNHRKTRKSDVSVDFFFLVCTQAIGIESEKDVHKMAEFLMNYRQHGREQRELMEVKVDPSQLNLSLCHSGNKIKYVAFLFCVFVRKRRQPTTNPLTLSIIMIY